MSMQGAMTPTAPSAEKPPLNDAEKAVLRSVTGNEYDLMPTHREDMRLIVERGHEPDFTKRELGRIAIWGSKFARLKDKIDGLAEQPEKPASSLKETAMQVEGFRGLELPKINRRIAVFPNVSKSYNIPVLSKALGSVATAVIRYDLQEHFTVPAGLETKHGPLTPGLLHDIVREALIKAGVPEADIEKIQMPTIEPHVDEEKLAELIENRQVVLPKNAVDIETVYKIRPQAIKPPKIRAQKKRFFRNGKAM